MTIIHNSYVDLLKYFCQHFVMNIFKHTGEGKEIYKKHTGFHHLDSTINLLLFLLPHTSMDSSVQPSVHLIFL